MEKRLFNFWKPCVLKHKLPLEKFNRSEFIIWQCEHQSKIFKKKKSMCLFIMNIEVHDLY